MRGKNARLLSTETKAEIRMRAVEAVKKGYKPKDVAAIFSVSRRAVEKWVKMEREGGKIALAESPQGRPEGSGRRLTLEQEKQIARTIINKAPEQLELPFVLWTRGAVQQWIQQMFCISLSLPTIGDYLRRWGLTPQKPAKKAWQRDDRKVKKWLEEEYPLIRERAKQEKARIYWGDETGCRSDHTAGKSYSLRGKTPIVRINGERFSCNVISAINNSGNMAFWVFKGKFNTPVFLAFLKRLIKHARKKIFLIIDGHPVHKAKIVQEWVEKHPNDIEIFYLPGYSPDLNPDEYLNNDLKSHLGKVTKPENQGQLIKFVRGYLFRKQKQPHIIRGYFQHPAVLYAANCE